MGAEIRLLMLQIMEWFFLFCAFVCVIRMLSGSDSADRLVALNVLAGIVLAFLVVHGVRDGRVFFLDVALVYDIFGFLGFLAIARFLKDTLSDDREDS